MNTVLPSPTVLIARELTPKASPRISPNNASGRRAYSAQSSQATSKGRTRHVIDATTGEEDRHQLTMKDACGAKGSIND
jgi:hypothetical protein